MGPFPNAHDRVSNITPKAGCQELDELHITARLEIEMPLLRWYCVVLFSPLAHAIFHDARDAFHTKQRFIQTVTTGILLPAKKSTHRPPEVIKFPMPAARHENKRKTPAMIQTRPIQTRPIQTRPPPMGAAPGTALGGVCFSSGLPLH